jgi:rifampicin phosphotransferase
MPTRIEEAVLVPLDAATDPSLCGHKAAALAALVRDGFDVPNGFVIPVGTEPSVSEIEEGLARLGDRAVAVRSSGVAEDLPDASYAGQYDTVLGVRGAEAVAAAASRVLASARSQRNAGYVEGSALMAVLVQAMVDADVAGVAFSANPLTGDRTEVVVNATRGLADALVAGASDGDEWSVRNGETRRTSRAEMVIDAPLAKRVADLARRVDAARGGPQDIEWAVEAGRLFLLQARPITVLPIAPQIEVPKGTWQKDVSHFPDPISPFAATTHLRDMAQAQAMIDTWGLMPDTATVRTIGHEFYVHIEPDDGGKNPPPWWVLGIVARILPSLRRKLKIAQRAVDSGLLESLPKRWRSELKPQLERELHAYVDLDLTTMTDRQLFEHLDELLAFSARNGQLHFQLHLPHTVGLHELATTCQELLGWETPRALELLQGLSTASSACTRELASIAALARSRPAGTADPEVGRRLQEYLRFWGIRTVGAEPGNPSIAECPDLVAQMLADLMEDPSPVDVSARRNLLVAEARAQLSAPEAREKFERALAYAEQVYPLREDNVILTDHLPGGLLRRVALEAGRRLVERGLLARHTDAVMLTAGELRQAVTGPAGESDLRSLVARRKAEHAWVRANPGPAVYGAKPGPLPDLRGLPSAARRLNGALLWDLAQEFNAPKPTTADTLGGIAASPGTYRGRVRVIRAPEHLAKLRAGEILVCPETSSAWMMVFRRAGALVTDHGSTLSHTAIVSREFGLPAVVATKNATSTLRDGDEVIVDGSRGTVTRC